MSDEPWNRKQKPEPPEVIRGWRDSQLSIARFYGGLTYQGHQYVIDENDDLVRWDVLQARARAAKAARKAAVESQQPEQGSLV
jgi:hypothetical protein